MSGRVGIRVVAAKREFVVSAATNDIILHVTSQKEVQLHHVDERPAMLHRKAGIYRLLLEMNAVE